MFCNVLYGNQDYTNVPQCLCLRQLLHRQQVADMDGVDPEFVCLVKQSNVFVLYSAILFSIPTGMFPSQYPVWPPRQHPQAFLQSLASSGVRLWGLCWVKRAVGGKFLPFHHHTSTPHLWLKYVCLSLNGFCFCVSFLYPQKVSIPCWLFLLQDRTHNKNSEFYN